MSDFPELTQTPVKRPLALGLAKLANAFNTYANDPNNIVAQALPVPQGAGVGLTSGLTSLLGIPDAAALLEKLAYGDNLTQGRGQTFSTAPGVFDGAMALTPAVGGLTKGLAKATAKIPAPTKGQMNALFPGAKDPGLFMSHAVMDDNLLVNPKGASFYEASKLPAELPAELYNVSFGINRDKLSDFRGNNTVLVPRLGAFDPKHENTILTTTDYYTPRWSDAAGRRIDEFRKDIPKRFRGNHSFSLDEFVNRRLADRFGGGFARGGFHQEGTTPRLLELPTYGRTGALEAFNGKIPGLARFRTGEVFQNRIWMSPFFRSLKEFEESHYGGKTIGKDRDHSITAAAEQLYRDLTRNLAIAPYYPGEPVDELHGGFGKVLRRLASGFAEPFRRSDKGRAFDKTDRAPFDFNTLLVRREGASQYSTNEDSFRPLTPEEIQQVRQTAGKILQKVKTAPSDYGENKVYGAVPLNPSRFAGIVYRGDSDAGFETLKKAADKRGLPVESVAAGDTAGEIEAANWLQDFAKNPKTITTGLAKSRVPKPDTVIPPKAALAGTGEHPLVQKYGNLPKGWELAPDIKTAHPELSWAQAEALSNLSKYSWYKHPDNPKMNDVDWSLKFNIVKNTAAELFPVEKAFPKAQPNNGLDDWLNKTFTLENLNDGAFDYVGDKQIDVLKTLAKKTGDLNLAEVVQKYEKTTQGTSISAHDLAMLDLVNYVDTIKNPKKAAAWDFNNLPTNLSTLTPLAKAQDAVFAADGKVTPENLASIVEWAKSIYKSTGNWKNSGEVLNEFPSLSKEQATILSNFSFGEYMVAKYGKHQESVLDTAENSLKSFFK